LSREVTCNFRPYLEIEWTSVKPNLNLEIEWTSVKPTLKR